jgi:arylsulfatase A
MRIGRKSKKKLSNKAKPPLNKPNIVLVFADDLGIEALNAYGGHGIKTPHLDRLAKEGMLFTHCFANPACSPSRAELLTGTYPVHNGIQHVLGKWEYKRSHSHP